MLITDHQRQLLTEAALTSNWADAGTGAEAPYADVIADLATGRDIADRDLFVSFLWRRVAVATEAGLSRKEHWVWTAAVLLLDELGECLDDVFAGHATTPPQRAAGRGGRESRR